MNVFLQGEPGLPGRPAPPINSEQIERVVLNYTSGINLKVFRCEHVTTSNSELQGIVMNCNELH